MKKTVCVALALLLALLCGCGGNGKSVPSRAGVTSEERQFTAPSDGDLIAIFSHQPGGSPRGAVPGRRANGRLQFRGAGPHGIL